MVAVFTGRTFAVHQIHPEIANTDARPVLDQRHSENNGLTSARTRTCSALRGHARRFEDLSAGCGGMTGRRHAGVATPKA